MFAKANATLEAIQDTAYALAEVEAAAAAVERAKGHDDELVGPRFHPTKWIAAVAKLAVLYGPSVTASIIAALGSCSGQTRLVTRFCCQAQTLIRICSGHSSSTV